MDYQQRNPLTDTEKEFYVNLVQLCPPGTVIFSKIKLAEVVKPTAESGTDKFYDDVKKILSHTLDFAVYDLNRNYTVAVVDYQDYERIDQQRNYFLKTILNECHIKYFVMSNISDMYRQDFFKE